MRLFIDSDDHYRYLIQSAESQPRTTRIASYGIYAGILADGRNVGDHFKSQVKEFLDKLNVGSGSTQMLIGNYEYKSCKGKDQCVDCERKYVFELIRLLNHTEAYPNFKWRVSTTSHIKCALFDYGSSYRGIAGGRNLTESSWADVTVELDKMSTMRLIEHFDDVWKKSRILDAESISSIIVKQNISPATIANIMGT